MHFRVEPGDVWSLLFLLVQFLNLDNRLPLFLYRLLPYVKLTKYISLAVHSCEAHPRVGGRHRCIPSFGHSGGRTVVN